MRLLIVTSLLFISPACIFGGQEAEGDDPNECSDDADNDQDGLFDCDDPDCDGSGACDTTDVIDDDSDDTDTDVATGLSIPAPHEDDPRPALQSCEDTPGPGATGWFDLTYEIENGDVRGYEAWALIPNSEWESSPGVDGPCQITWEVSGTADVDTACTACDYSLDLSYELLRSASDCVSGLVESESDPFTTRLNVSVSSSGQVDIAFESGTPYGMGLVSGGIVDMRSTARCFFF